MRSLKAMPGAMRIRVGDYRIVYLVNHGEHQIDVIDIDKTSTASRRRMD